VTRGLLKDKKKRGQSKPDTNVGPSLAVYMFSSRTQSLRILFEDAVHCASNTCNPSCICMYEILRHNLQRLAPFTRSRTPNQSKSRGRKSSVRDSKVSMRLCSLCCLSRTSPLLQQPCAHRIWKLNTESEDPVSSSSSSSSSAVSNRLLLASQKHIAKYHRQHMQMKTSISSPFIPPPTCFYPDRQLITTARLQLPSLLRPSSSLLQKIEITR
jgi:hypothetical protein